MIASSTEKLKSLRCAVEAIPAWMMDLFLFRPRVLSALGRSDWIDDALERPPTSFSRFQKRASDEKPATCPAVHALPLPSLVDGKHKARGEPPAFAFQRPLTVRTHVTSLQSPIAALSFAFSALILDSRSCIWSADDTRTADTAHPSSRCQKSSFDRNSSATEMSPSQKPGSPSPIAQSAAPARARDMFFPMRAEIPPAIATTPNTMTIVPQTVYLFTPTSMSNQIDEVSPKNAVSPLRSARTPPVKVIAPARMVKGLRERFEVTNAGGVMRLGASESRLLPSEGSSCSLPELVSTIVFQSKA